MCVSVSVSVLACCMDSLNNERHSKFCMSIFFFISLGTKTHLKSLKWHFIERYGITDLSNRNRPTRVFHFKHKTSNKFINEPKFEFFKIWVVVRRVVGRSCDVW